jgi:hypothetical protein
VEFAEPGPSGGAELRRQAQHSRRVRRLGLLLGLACVVGSIVLFGTASVFLWVPAVLVGLLVGVELAEVTRPRPRWRVGVPARRPRRSEQIAPELLWTMRAVVAGEAAAASSLWSSGQLDGAVGPLSLVPPLLAWALAEGALLRVLLRPLAAEGADVPVDEGVRTWTAHLVTGAASVLALLPLGVLLLVAGIGLGDRTTRGFDVLPVALIAGGFSALVAGVAVGVFLLPWLRPLRLSERALAG